MYKTILCIGNALVDQVCKLENDDLLFSEKLPKGSMQLVDSDRILRLLDLSKGLENKRVTGGSAANTASGLAQMGIQTSFIGVVGKDELGDFFVEDLKANRIEPCVLRTATLPTGLALTFVSPDGERSFATCLAAAQSLSAEDIDEAFVSSFDHIHLEGYLIGNRDLFEKVVGIAKRHNRKLSVDLASYNVVEENLDFLKRTLQGVEVIFANEQEAKAFCGMEAEKAVVEIAKYATIAVVKIGKDGSLVRYQGQTYRIDKSAHPLVDTTGAGDLYAGGFLAGLCQGKGIVDCGTMGSVIAGNVVSVIGTKMSEEHWATIRSELNLTKN